ncbi:MAG TPA: efflux RND transporter periplasmic adaptor subunit [Planctomycetota bacterium]|nr:efflux RND transporter periplasmic adaptor subunit [Planctomycetota bacterium]
MFFRSARSRARALRLAASLAPLLLAPACDRAAAPQAATPASESASPAAAHGWHCPMHPSVRSDGPGSCPICHMDLVPDEPAAAGEPGAVEGRAPVALTEDRQQLIGVRLETVAEESFVQTLRVAARVEVDERRLSAVSLRFGGWIEELAVQAVGQLVRPGDALFTVYSPELLEAEKGYALARGSLAASDSLVAAARERLAKWDVGEDELHALEAGAAPEPRTVVRAKTGGVVTRRDVVQGARVEAGQQLLQLADLASVWVDGDVYEGELPWLHAGQAATLELLGGGAPIETTLSFVFPWIEPATRTARVRAEVDNADGRLLPGQYGALAIRIDHGPQLTVDADAVVQTGERALVFVAQPGGHFEPRAVELGARSGGRIVVTAGLQAGERVVARGTFLVDSESRLHATLAEAAAVAVPGQSDASSPAHQH